MNAYIKAALDCACAAILAAPNGAQETTLHREAYSIGGLIGPDLAESEAFAVLLSAAKALPAYGEPWRNIERKLRYSLGRGMERPWTPRKGRGRPHTTASRQCQSRVAVGSANGHTTTVDALRIWREAIDPRGTLAERYLVEQRKLFLRDDLTGEVLRWHSGLGAMLVLFRNILTGKPQAISRIYLDRHGRKIERKFVGPVGAAAVMLDPFDCVTHGLFIAEGVETCMAGRQWDLRPAWALGSAGAIETFPVLDGVECLTILAEHCARNARAVEVCGCRWSAAGREVLINRSIIGKDLNDAVMKFAT
jgi:hypothetical protein